MHSTRVPDLLGLEDGRVLRSERRYGDASRSFLLANNVDPAGADAKYSNGLLGRAGFIRGF